jgi:pyruvate kinase
MLRGGKDIVLEKGQELTLVAVGAEYETWEGFKDPASGELARWEIRNHSKSAGR